ncbi:MAG TPA: aspartate kinase [Bacteroidales bacterium]|jgi:aspartate kinase|nr:aspartate kinase [Bacteroidales bacterium]
MKVYKFGGASVKDAAGIINLSGILSLEKGDLIVVVSAFGKTTNALEKVHSQWYSGTDYSSALEEVFNYHNAIMKDLFTGCNPVRNEIDASFSGLRDYLSQEEKEGFDFSYDQVVSHGEIWSTIIVGGYLKTVFAGAEWKDIRKILVTDNRYRDANVIWDESAARASEVFNFQRARIYVTQGFIGGTIDGNSTTLGREGSDYSAAILANMLGAESVTVWKDVPGILNADPKWMDDAVKMDEISYREAVEMAFSGAKVIHPKTIKPVHNKNIPLHVKSFLTPGSKGTIIISDPDIKKVLPVFIRKENQMLISILPNDFSFVMGDNLSRIFRYFSERGIKVNLVEASAVSIDVCVNHESPHVEEIINFLKPEFSIVYNENVELLTVRHYNEEAVRKITAGREILLEQRTRSMVRFVVRCPSRPPQMGRSEI